MADQELAKGQLAPAAKPVSSFLGYQSAAPAAPARPEAMGSVSGINVIQRGGEMNVQGTNSVAELAAALKPLGAIVDAGLELYAGNEYKKGKNEVLRANALVNRQTLAAGDEYAADNREVARQNPVAGMMMDRVNPFRQAGRQNQASQLVAQEMPRAFRQAWRDNSDRLAKVDGAGPELDQVRANVVTQMATKFGLDEFSPGFQDYVLPVVNREWEEFQTRHMTARTGYLKDTQHVLLQNQLYSQLIGFDPSVTTPEQLLSNLGGLMDANARQMGIPEEASEMRSKAVVGLVQRLQGIAGDPSNPLSGQARKMLGIVSQIPSGLVGADGVPLTVGETDGMDILEGMDKMSQIQRRQRDAAQEDLGLSFEETWGPQLEKARGTPDYEVVLDAALNDPRFKDMSFVKKRETLVELGTLSENFTALQVPKEEIEGWFQGLEDRFGSDWDERTARNEFNALQASIPASATKEREKARDRFEELVRRRRSEGESNYNTSLINRSITDTMKAQLSQRYPDVTEAALQGISNIEGILAYGDSYRKAATKRLNSALNQQIYADLGAATAANKGKLTPDQQQQVIDKAIEKVTGNKERMLQLMPPIKSSGGQPKDAEGKPVPPPPGRKPAQVQTFSPGTLNSVPEERIKQWKSTPLLKASDTQQLLLDAMNGKQLPAPFRRAAIRAGTTPEQLLLQQADFYPGAAFTPTPAQRKAILRQGNRAEGLRQSTASGGMPIFGPLSATSQMIGNLLTGSAPAYARSFNPATDNPYTGRPYSNGGSSWEKGPAVAASHRDSGSGYTIPGARDANGRPPIFSRGGANAFAAMVRDSNGQVKPGDIASSQRTRGKNAAVGGVNGSEHLGGNAMDIHGASEAWIRKNGAKYGWYIHDYAGSHGGHFEFRGGGGSPTPQVATRKGGGMTGLATYYNGSGGSDGVAGGPTANGETYNPNAMTAAVQLSLRGKYMNKWVTVEDIDSGKTVRVWVNDVGSMGGTERSVSKTDPRVIDLSPAAFKKLFGSTSRGVGRIRIVPR